MNGFICWKGFTAHYVQIGNGPTPMLAFPGFHRECHDFNVFKSSLGEKFTIYAFDLFYHGQSEILDSTHPFDEQELKTMVDMLCQLQKIDRFALMGYSLGGKIALSVYQYFAIRVTDLYLFAPYGLKPNKLLNQMESWALAKKAFHHLIRNPGLFFVAINLLRSLRILEKRRHEFLQHQMESEHRRRMLFNTWLCYKSIKPDIQLISKKLEVSTTKIKLFYGSLDPVEPPEHALLFTKHLKQANTLTIVPTGHNLICEKTNSILHEQLADKS